MSWGAMWSSLGYKWEKFCSWNSSWNTTSNGVFITHLEICPLAADKGKIALPVDRPTVKFLTVEPAGRPRDRPMPSLRSTVRLTAPTREWGTCSRSTERSTGPSGWLCARHRARQSTVPVNRLLVRSTARAWQGQFSGFKNLSFWFN